MKKARVFFILALIGLLFGGIILVKAKKKALKETPLPLKAPLPVEIVKVKQDRLEILEHYLGTIVPIRKAVISTKLFGYILKLPKYEGDVVKAGEVLVEIEAKGLRARLSSLSAELLAAENELLTRKKIFLRNKELLAHEAISREAYELSQSAYELAKAKVKKLRQEIAAIKADLSYAKIVAPFSGVVTRRFKEPRELAAPGIPLLEIEDPQSGYRILVKIPQEKAPKLIKGAKAYLTLGKRKILASVFQVHPAVGNQALATVEIRLKKRPFSLPSGASVGVDLVLGCPEGFIIPVRALASGKRKAVYVVRNGHLVLVPVKVLGKSQDLFVCKGELSPGESVVVGDPGLLLRLAPGMRVLPYPKGRNL